MWPTTLIQYTQKGDVNSEYKLRWFGGKCISEMQNKQTPTAVPQMMPPPLRRPSPHRRLPTPKRRAELSAERMVKMAATVRGWSGGGLKLIHYVPFKNKRGREVKKGGVGERRNFWDSWTSRRVKRDIINVSPFPRPCQSIYISTFGK